MKKDSGLNNDNIKAVIGEDRFLLETAFEEDEISDIVSNIISLTDKNIPKKMIGENIINFYNKFLSTSAFQLSMLTNHGAIFSGNMGDLWCGNMTNPKIIILTEFSGRYRSEKEPNTWQKLIDELAVRMDVVPYQLQNICLGMSVFPCWMAKKMSQIPTKGVELLYLIIKFALVLFKPSLVIGIGDAIIPHLSCQFKLDLDDKLKLIKFDKTTFNTIKVECGKKSTPVSLQCILISHPIVLTEKFWEDKCPDKVEEKLEKHLTNYQHKANLMSGIVRHHIGTGEIKSMCDILMSSRIKPIIKPIEDIMEPKLEMKEESIKESKIDPLPLHLDSMNDSELLTFISKTSPEEEEETDVKLALSIAHKYWKWLNVDPETRDIMPKEYSFWVKEDLFDNTGTPITCKCSQCHGECAITKECKRCICTEHGHRGYFYNECRVFKESKDNCFVESVLFEKKEVIN